jgi:hypothetical protein
LVCDYISGAEAKKIVEINPNVAKILYLRVAIAHQILPIPAVNGGQCPPYTGNLILSSFLLRAIM